MTVLACLPARGGSKGVPGKNLRQLGGQSLLGRCIEMAQKCVTVDRLIVSTDCLLIRAEAERFGCEVVMRPAELAEDHTLPDPAILHVIDHLGMDCTVAVRLNCTAPFTTAGDVDRCVTAVQNSGYTLSAVSVVDFSHYLVGPNGGLVNRPHEMRRQLMQPQWWINGGVSAGPVGTLRRLLNVVDYQRPGSPIPIPADFRWPCEIDEPDDFRYAKQLLGLT